VKNPIAGDLWGDHDTNGKTTTDGTSCCCWTYENGGN